MFIRRELSVDNNKGRGWESAMLESFMISKRNRASKHSSLVNTRKESRIDPTFSMHGIRMI